MSVPKHNRSESKVEFDNTYHKIYEDAVKLINCQFGANSEIKEKYTLYIATISKEVLSSVSELGKHIRIANSIYPVSKYEYEIRRVEQEKAIGLCFDLLTKYQLIMKTIGTKDNKYAQEIGNLTHEINCLKNWRASDNKRFANLG